MTIIQYGQPRFRRNDLKPGGRLLFPMAVTRGPDGMLPITRLDGDEFGARFLCGLPLNFAVRGTLT
jgi:hypothetical protein